jgi:hypothetical protein
LRDSYKRFVPYRGSWILTLKDLFCIVSHESSRFSKNLFCGFVSWRIFKRFDESDESYESSQILSTIDLWIHTNPVLPDSRIQSIFKRFVSWIRFVTQFSNTCFVDSICKTKNLKRFDLFHFGRIRIRIPHPYCKPLFGYKLKLKYPKVTLCV